MNLNSSEDEVVIRISPAGIILGWNQGAEKVLGYSDNEIIGRHLGTLTNVGSTDAGHMSPQYLTEEIKTQNEWRRKDGSMVSLSVTTYPISNGLVITNGFYAVAKDKSNTEAMQERIDQLTKQLESLTYSVSHDLRAPVRSILNYAQILEDEYAKNLDAEGHKVISIIARNSHTLMHLIEDLLGLARVWKQEVTSTTVDMNALVRAVVNEQRADQPNRKFEIHVEDLHAAHGDSILLKQVWRNLISNAMKYTGKKENPCIEIGCSVSHQNVTYFVKDNGAGFDMAYANKLFAPFQRLHTQSEFDGNGVGLAVVQHIITKHCGRVWTAAKRNEGATFYFSLPRQQSS